MIMKKLLLSLSAILILGLPKISAQLINADFETWTTNTLVPSAMDPNGGNGTNGWWDFNMFNSALLGGSPITVFRDNTSPSPYHGSYCAKIISDTMSASSYSALHTYGFAYPKTNGLIITGNINVGFSGASVKIGVPFTTDIRSFSFYYRYIPNGVDTCSCTVVLYHQRHTIAAGTWSNKNTVSSWKQDSVVLHYDSATNSKIDTIFIQFSACSLLSNPKQYDTMNIDYSSDIALGIGNINAPHDNVNLYPNPANSEINLSVTGQYRAANVEIYDITGKSIGTYPIRNNFLTINTQSLNSGLYIYKLLDDSGNQLNVGKFSVVK
jgi:hypothetical protein